MADKQTLKVKLVRSVIGTKQSHRDTVRGMINKIAYLVQVL
jgi:large subunit ribosomal protein L30